MDTASALIQQGLAHHRRNQFHLAEVCYRRALAIDQTCADGWHLLGMIADAAGKDEDAINLIRRAITLNSGRADFLNNLGAIHEPRGEYDLAENAFREAIRLRPGYAAAHNNLGEVMKDLGRVGESVACYREALNHAPEFHQAGSNLLMGLNYDPNAGREEMLTEHRRWGQAIERNTAPLPLQECCTPSRPTMRIAYVSPDFRQHAVARFIEPVLASHNKDRFDAFLYAECPVVDAVSERLRSSVRAWRSTRGRSSQQVAEEIRHDQVDILVDLAGHTRNNRLDVFALRAAPIQVTYLGYPNTTGMKRMDYRITDSVLNPPDEPSWATEELIRLRGHGYCFQPPEDAPEPVPPPCMQNGVITFGSHHPPIKLNDAVLTLWGRVLLAIPNSRLLMFRNSFNQIVQKELTERMKRCGIPLDRVEFRCPTDKSKSYLPLFNEVDIVLDSFPFTGHTMTCEALWMGVPVLTLRGDRPAGRLSSSVLAALGMTDWIAETPDDYVLKAVAVSRDVRQLADLRASLRGMMTDRICNAQAFTRHLEATYEAIWQKVVDRSALK